MANATASLVRGKVARFTLTDGCGMPQAGMSTYVTDAFLEINSTKNMDTGDEIKVRRANGIIGTYEPGQVSLLNFTVETHFEKMDVAALAMLTGDAAILGANGTDIVGFTERAGRILTQNFAMEVWSDSSGPSACVSGQRVYGYMLYPELGQSYITLENITDKEVNGTIHSVTYGGPSWGRGPYGSSTDGSNIRGPINTASTGNPAAGRLLLPVAADEHRHFEITPIAPPAAQTANGPQTLTLPTTY